VLALSRVRESARTAARDSGETGNEDDQQTDEKAVDEGGPRGSDPANHKGD
jgi:hypothetical protein